ncbi:MAG: tRNA (adenosine(37)-N6)-dimethylallyltransferase MiaA [Oscillospiraceae bacterium]|nr:tRNA (adenosine(37)-N6)-dimethylallyltransferase MiaA [Oscillospiraceae bacterium]
MAGYSKIPVAAIVGPTAAGKTRLGVELCLRFGGEVISGDSMQIYREMDIATAKPSPEETRGVAHHLIDFLDPGEEFSVADYLELAHKAALDIYSRGKLPFLVGGTGLYVSSFLEDLRFADIKVNRERKARLEEIAAHEGSADLYALLEKLDPELAAGLSPNDANRIIRGILVFEAEGKSLSDFKRESRPESPRYDSLLIGLNFRSRGKLYERIDSRVDHMLAAGLLDEAGFFYRRGLSRTSRAAIGYKELYPFIRGEITLEEAAENLKRETRRFAKRQLTWFKKTKNINWIYIDDYSGFDDITDAAAELLETAFALPRGRNGVLA